MQAVLSVLEFASPSVQQSRPSRKGGQGSLQPKLPVDFVDVFHALAGSCPGLIFVKVKMPSR